MTKLIESSYSTVSNATEITMKQNHNEENKNQSKLNIAFFQLVAIAYHWCPQWFHCRFDEQRPTVLTSTYSHTHTLNHFMAVWTLSRTTQVSWYQKKHSPTHTYYGHQPSLICFLHLLRSMASSLFNLRACQLFSTICLQVFFGLPLGLAPSTSTPFISSTNHCLLFTAHAHTIATCFAVVPRSYHPILLGTLSCSLMPHIHLTIFISVC